MRGAWLQEKATARVQGRAAKRSANATPQKLLSQEIGDLDLSFLDKSESNNS